MTLDGLVNSYQVTCPGHARTRWVASLLLVRRKACAILPARLPSGCRFRRPGRAPRRRLAEPGVQPGVFQVLDDHAVLVDEDHPAEIARLEGAEDHLLALDGRVQVVDAVGDVRQVPELPQGDLGRVD